MKRFLIIKMWALGDILMATPLIAALRTKYPDCNISWGIEASHADLLAGHPGIDELLPIDTVTWRKMLKDGDGGGWLKVARHLRAQMRQRRFDAVINCQPEKWWSAILCMAPVRIALYPTESLPVSRRFYTKALNRPKSPQMHNTDHYLTAAQALDCPVEDKRLTLGETADEESYWRELRPCSNAPIVVLSPFSNGKNRCWELERYAQLAERLNQHEAMDVIVTCGPGDSAEAEWIKLQCAAPITIAQGTTLREYISIIRHADLVITGDSSPMHIAAAVGTPYVALFGPTPTAERVPLIGAGTAISKPLHCAPCDSPICGNPRFRECMQLISVNEVESAALTLLAKVCAV